MSKSWNWRIAPFSTQDAEHYQRNAADERFPQYRHYYLCRKKGCGAIPEVFVRYDYVTGRQGRVSWQQKPYCRAHGEQIVAAHRQPGGRMSKRLSSATPSDTAPMRVLRDLPNEPGYKFIGVDLDGKEWECRVVKDAVGCHTVERCCDYEPFFFKLYGWRPLP